MMPTTNQFQNDFSTLTGALMNTGCLSAAAAGFKVGGPMGAALGVGNYLLTQANTNPALQSSLTNMALLMGGQTMQTMLTNTNGSFMQNMQAMMTGLGPMFDNIQNPQTRAAFQSGMNQFMTSLESLQPNAQQQQQAQQTQQAQQQQNPMSKLKGALAGMTLIASEMKPQPGTGTGMVNKIEAVVHTVSNFMKSFMKPPGPGGK
jgi:hypothetical protein